MTNEIKDLSILGFPKYGIDLNGTLYTTQIRGTKKLCPYVPVRLGTSSGYYSYTLSENGRKKTIRIHRIMAKIFLDLRDSRVVNHVDGNKKNNKIDNLELVTIGENVRHAFKLGLVKRSGASNSGAKIDDLAASTIKTLAISGWRNKDIAPFFNLKENTISQIRNGNSWKHLNV